MSITLADPYLKTSRAKIHLDSLREEINIFRESKPHHYTRERDTKNQRYRIRFKVADIPDPIPLIVGDFVCCLRASLDQLVWSLAKLNRLYPLHTHFPILDAPNGKEIRACTAGVPAGARDIIKSLQPYNRPQSTMRSHLLWRLNALCNVDKHRRLPVRGDISYLFFPDLPKEFWHLVALDDTGVVSVPLHLESKMRLEPNVSFNIIFGDPIEAVACDLDGLQSMYDFVANNVIPRFSRFFK